MINFLNLPIIYKRYIPYPSISGDLYEIEITRIVILKGSPGFSFMVYV